MTLNCQNFNFWQSLYNVYYYLLMPIVFFFIFHMHQNHYFLSSMSCVSDVATNSDCYSMLHFMLIYSKNLSFVRPIYKMHSWYTNFGQCWVTYTQKLCMQHFNSTFCNAISLPIMHIGFLSNVGYEIDTQITFRQNVWRGGGVLTLQSTL